MDIKILNEKVNELAEIRKQGALAKEFIDLQRAQFEKTIADRVEALQELRNQVNTLQDEILTVLRESNTKNWKTERATVSRKTSISYVISDKQKLLDNLKELHLDKEYTSVEFKPTIKGLFEQKDLAGVDKSEKEFISVILKKDENNPKGHEKDNH